MNWNEFRKTDPAGRLPSLRPDRMTPHARMARRASHVRRAGNIRARFACRVIARAPAKAVKPVT